jgi:purine-binding chemotaxis protein CheW
MEDYPYLIFNLNTSLYGITTMLVEEIFSLPELTPIPEAPPDIVGVVNVRGDILPVMDLNLRFGYESPDYQLSDTVIVLRSEEIRIGLIVNTVKEVRNISGEEITKELSHGRKVSKLDSKKFITGVARSEGDILILIDADHLLNYVAKQDVDFESAEIEDQANLNADFLKKKRVFCPHATPEERAVFLKRAEALKQTNETEDVTGLKPLAVIILNEEFFGVDLKLVREFSEIKKVTPVPCAPSHIIGNMNLRGEILTLIDVCGLLNLPLKNINKNNKAMVIQVEDIVTGITVEEVYDVMFLNPQEITTVPTAIHSINDEYLQGAAPYRDKMMSILDLPKILLSGNLTVDQAA